MRKLLQRIFSLRVTLLTIVLLCWLIPTVLLGSFMGTRFFHALQEKTEAFLTTGAQQAQDRTLENIINVITLSKDAVYDGELSATVADYEKNRITYAEFFRICRSYLERKYARERLCSFALFFRMDAPESMLFTSDGYDAATDFVSNVQAKALALSSQLDTSCYFYQQGEQTYLMRNLYNTRMEKYGMLLLGLDTEAIFSHIQEWCDKWEATYSVVLDGYRTGMMEHMDLPIGLSEDENLLLYTLASNTRDYSFRFQVQADKHSVYHEMDTFQGLMQWMFGLLAPLCVLMVYFVNRRIVRPIQILSNASARIRNGEFGITVPFHGKDELGQLGVAFSDMSLQLKTLVDKSYKEEIALRDARIQAMQSRLNPHFLNNALESINWQARMEGSEPIAAMVEALSLLLNATMDRAEQHLVPLHQEMQVADAYFYFVGLRFGDRLTVFQNVSQGLGDPMVPRLALQTLLENAIEHGIGPAGGGRIRVNVFAQAGSLVIEVLNNGRKLSVEDRRRITRLLGDDSDNGEHLGIRNVARRLRLLYGNRASLTISTDEHGDTLAQMRLPIDPPAERISPRPRSLAPELPAVKTPPHAPNPTDIQEEQS